jgi:hypothetical protein
MLNTRMLINCCVCVCFLHLLLTVQAAQARTENRARVGRFVVTWQRDYSDNRTGDKIRLLNVRASMRGRVQMNRCLYTFFDGTYFEFARPWAAKISRKLAADGIVVRTHFGTGSGVEEIIIANAHGQFRQLFKGFSNKVEVVGKHRVPLIMRDLDCDGIPEIVFVPTFEPFRGSNPGSASAEVWKWSINRRKYVKVRTSPYAKRFMPLKRVRIQL